MPPNPLVRSATRNRKEWQPIKREKGGRANATDSSHHGDYRRSREHLAASVQQQYQDGFQKVTFASPTNPKEKSHWELYNDLTLVYDREMIKEWDDSLSLMLVYGALFSGVLTAFIVRSIDLLTEEENPPINVILQTISHQLANFSTTPYTYVRDPTNPPPRTWTVKVNALFFTSLGCTLIVSLTSVLCLQWVRDFDKGLASITNPAERALKRQFRLEGLKKWHLPTMVGILPTLLVIALILFMAGIVVWLRGISRTLTVISCIVLVLGGGFYVVTGICAAIFPSAPFNSSASRLVEFLLLLIVRSSQSVYSRHLAPKSSREEWELMPSLSSEATAFLAGHRHREDEAIASDSRLPSASLLWLLSHIDITSSTMQRLEDILKALLNVDSPESMLDSYGKYKVPWSKILSFLAAQIDDSELERPSFEPKTLAKLQVLAQVAGTVGVQSYSETLYEVFSSPPTTLPDFQSSPVGIYTRFVRWRWGIPMPCDQSAPLHLLKDLAKVSGLSSPAFTLAWLSELRTLLTEQFITREFVLEVLTELCTSQASYPLPFFTQDVSPFCHVDVLRHVIITMIMVLNPEISQRKFTRAKEQSLDELLGTLVLWYEFSMAQEERHRNHRHHQNHHLKEFDSLMKQLIHGLLLEFGDSPMEVQIRAMRQMRRPVIRALVHSSPESVCGIEIKPESTTTDHHFHYVEEGLQALAMEKGGARWGDELANLLFGYLRAIRKTGTMYTARERMFSIEVLLTVAYLVSEDKSQKEGEGGQQPTILGFWNGNDSLLVVLNALSSLASAMNVPPTAFMLSSGIGSYVLPILGKWMEREQKNELVDKAAQIQDWTLRWYAYQLLGLEYESILPDSEEDNAHWESPSWRQALYEWSMLPLRSRTSDRNVLITLAERKDRNHDLVILNYFSTRLSEQKPEDTEYGRDQLPACLQLLSAALFVLPLVPHLTVSTVGFMGKILDFQYGMRYFIDYGGLEWLSGLPQDVKLTESQKEDIEEEEEENETDTATDPFHILLMWFEKGYLETLDDQYLSTILRSKLVTSDAGDREPRWFLGFTVRALNHLSTLPYASGSSTNRVVFPEAAECCIRILNHQLSTQQPAGSSSFLPVLQETSTQHLLPPPLLDRSASTDHPWFIPAYGDVFIQADFQAWQLFVRGLIRTLRGEKGLSYPSTPEE